MKRKIAFFLSFLSIFSLLCFSPLRAEEGGFVLSKGGRVHLRKAPTQKSKSLGLYYVGTPLVFSKVEGNDEWLAVTIGKDSGYMSAQFVSSDGSKKILPKAYISLDQEVHLREAPNVDAPSLGSYRFMDKLTVLGETADHWYLADIDGNIGYIKASFVRLYKEPDLNTKSQSEKNAVIDSKGKSPVHMREKPSRQANSLGLFYPGAAMEVIGMAGEEWMHIKAADMQGYVHADLLAFGPDAEAVAKHGKKAVVRSESIIHMRQGPRREAAPLDVLPNGASVTIFGELMSEWYYIQHGTRFGYVEGQYIIPER